MTAGPQPNLVEVLARRQGTLANARADHDRLLAETADRLSAVEKEAVEARLHLAAVYLPRFNKESLARAERLTGFRGFSQRDPRAALAQETVVLQKTVERLEADERYRRRAFLVGPVGERTRALEEARSLLEPWEADCRRFEGLPEFLTLVDLGYDTPAYTVHWNETRYWKLWAAGDAVCEALGLGDFGDDVLPAWRAVEAERRKWRDQVQAAEAAVEEIHEIVRQHDEAVARLPRLEEIYQTQCREALAGHFLHADPGLLESWLEGEADRGLLVALRRAAGLKAKEDLLVELLDGLRRFAGDLARREAKIERTIDKAIRKPALVGSIDPDDVFDAKVARWEASRLGAEKALARLEAYDSYSRFSLSNPPELWWFEFTGSRPSRYHTRLRDWYEKNPDARPSHDRHREDRSNLETVAVATAAHEARADLGYVS